MLRNLNKFNFPYYSCKIAKPYPNGLVDQRDSFRVQLCNNFILDIAKKYIKHIPYFALKYESYIGYTVPLLLWQKYKCYFNTCSHGVSVL